MKRFCLATAALLGLATAVSAADLPARAAPPAPFAAVPVFTWTGFYVGAQAGYLWSDSDAKLSDVGGSVLSNDVRNGVFPRSVRLEQDGITGGVQAGYNVQFGTFVLGVEGDISFANTDVTTIFSTIDPAPPFTGMQVNSTYRSELDWLGTLRARAGVTFDRTLVYATGGLAVGEVKNTFAVGIPAALYSSSWASRDTEWGWTIGAGVEYALTRNISLKAEYLYYDLGDRTVKATDSVNFPGNHIDYKFKNDGNIARAGLNFRF